MVGAFTRGDAAVNGTLTTDLSVIASEDNRITGNGTFTGSIINAESGDVVKIDVVKGNRVTIAPRANHVVAVATSVLSPDRMQIVVNDERGTGEVIIRASNSDNPQTLATETLYEGGTVLRTGTLRVTNSNSLGQGWIGILGGAAEKTSIFGTYNTDSVFIGGTDPGRPKKIQPVYLLSLPDADRKLQYVNVDVDTLSTAATGFRFNNGLAQLDLAKGLIGNSLVPYKPGSDEMLVPADENSSHYVRLVKTGKGVLHIYGDTVGNDLTTKNWVAHTTVSDDHLGLDGAFHRGGTTVAEGKLIVKAGRGATDYDRFRASLGRTWTTYQGKDSTPKHYPDWNFDPVAFYDNALNNGATYNPLLVKADAEVELDRSQFFGDFNINGADGDKKWGVFHATDYQITRDGARVSYPQITVGLHGKDSYADGLLKGQFDLILNSVFAVRPSNDGRSSAIAVPGQAVLFINNPNNEIGAARKTGVMDGVLEIAGAKSIGGGPVTIGGRYRGFETEDIGVFAASQTFDLPNQTWGRHQGAAAAVTGKTLSFKKICLENTQATVPHYFRINPPAVELGYGYRFSRNGGEDYRDEIGGGNPHTFHGAWTGTVAFGVDGGKWNVAGVIRNATRVEVERGVWHLGSYPGSYTGEPNDPDHSTKASQNTKPYLHTWVWPQATLSLGDGVRNFNSDEAHRMNLFVTDDSRIRVVVNDSDIAKTRAEAMTKTPVFEAYQIDYAGLGNGQEDRDRRLVIQIDPSKLSTPKTIPAGWIKAVTSEVAYQWNNLHFLRESSGVDGIIKRHEDYRKVRVGWASNSDLIEETEAVAHLDENTNTILIEFVKAVTDPVDATQPSPTPTTVTSKSTVSIQSSTTLGETDNLVLGMSAMDIDASGGKITKLKDADGNLVAVSDVKVKIGSKEISNYTVALVGGAWQITVPAAEVPTGTNAVSLTGTLADGKTINTVNGGSITKATTPDTKDTTDTKDTDTTPTPSDDGGSSGGCDVGFGALSIAIAAAFLLRKKD
jgi:Synergist-CTERM protein sorting domain-containing protein